MEQRGQGKVPFALQASSEGVEAMSSWLALELLAPQGVGDGVEEGILVFDCLDARTDQGVGAGILGIVAVAV